MKYPNIIVLALVIGVSGCVPSKWNALADAEQLNDEQINRYCNSANPNAALCTQAQTRAGELAATRVQYKREDEARCARAWQTYDRKIKNFDRELENYDRALDRHERNKDRKSRECERKQDRYQRELDRYQRCLDRQSNSTDTYSSYSYCSSPIAPFCLSSFELRPSKPREPTEPFCERP